MLDLCTWRARIGCFVSFCASGHSPKDKRCGKPTKFSNVQHVKIVGVTDVLLSFGLLCTVFWLGVSATNTVSALFSSPSCTPRSPLVLSLGTSTNYVSDNGSKSVNLAYALTFDLTFCFVFLCEIGLQMFHSQRLLLSGDIEENPGPGDHNINKDETQTTREPKVDGIGEKLSALESSLRREMSAVLSAVRDQSDTLKQVAESLKQLQEEQKEIRNTLCKFAEDIQETKRCVQENRDRINDVDARHDEIEHMTSELEEEMDRLESFSRRNNMKFFGIPEAAGGEENCEDTINNLLKKYAPEQKWSEDTIDRAHRLGRPDPRNSRPRPVIAKFLRWSDAMKIMRDRNVRSSMEADGLRVAQDITKRQSAKLRELRSEGKTGYYVNGQLRIKDPATDRHPGPRFSPRRDDPPGATPPSPALNSDVRSRSTADASTRPCTTPASSPVPSQPRATRASVADTRQRQPSVREAWGKKSTRSQDRNK